MSEADLAVERLIKIRIGQAYPGDGFLGEETGLANVDDAEGTWVVDPIDGTQSFVNDLPTWSVSIAYIREAQPVLGAVYAPVARECFIGGRGVPATLNGRAIQVSTATSLTQGLTNLGYSSRLGPELLVPVVDRLLNRGGMFVRNGSGALGLCDVAAGRILGYVEAHINSYDCLGGLAVLHAAGGVCNDFLVGDALTEGNWFVAGPPQLYNALSSVLGVLPTEVGDTGARCWT